MTVNRVVNGRQTAEADRLSTQSCGDLGQKDDGGEGGERLPMLVHLVSMDQEVDSADTAAIRSNGAELRAHVASVGLRSIRFEGWHSEWDVHAVAARGGCGV